MAELTNPLPRGKSIEQKTKLYLQKVIDVEAITAIQGASIMYALALPRLFG